MIILKIVLWIAAIAAVVGVGAFLADIIQQQGGEHKPYGPSVRCKRW